jgi:hypothetical protein
MSHLLPFQIENFSAYYYALQRVGIDPGFIMYTNHHASDDLPAARLMATNQIGAAQNYITSPTDESFRRLVELGVLLDTEWDRETQHWEIISFQGWEALHQAFSRLHAKSQQSLKDLTGGSELELTELF